MTNFKISASILSADFARLGENVTQVIAAGADMIHVDVMDNHYVPNLTFGPLVCSALRKFGVTAFLDVHLVCKPVDRLIIDFAKAGANQITIHPEATDNLDRSLQLIRENNCGVGLVINPATSLEVLKHVIEQLDFILIMSVNPGFGGQQFIPEAINKIHNAKQMIAASGRTIRLGIDGGVKKNNIRETAQAGADTFIMGSAIFESKNYAETIMEIKKELM